DAHEVLRGLERAQRFMVPACGFLVVPDFLVRVADKQQEVPSKGQIGMADLAQEAVSIQEVAPGLWKIAGIVLDQAEHMADSHQELESLAAQLKNIKQGARAGGVLLTVHPPPFSYSPPARAGGSGGNHGSSLAMLREIDAICKAQGVYPHAFISGHAH